MINVIIMYSTGGSFEGTMFVKLMSCKLFDLIKKIFLFACIYIYIYHMYVYECKLSF